MKWLGLSRLAAVVAMGCLAAVGQAADVTYTFNVPVDVRTIVGDLNVRCFLSASDAPVFDRDHPEMARLLGAAIVPVPMVQGNHAGTLTVALPLAPEKAIHVRSWRCELSAQQGADADGLVRNAEHCVIRHQVAYCPKEGAVFVNITSGLVGTSGGAQ